jgi:hypothetical protein
LAYALYLLASPLLEKRGDAAVVIVLLLVQGQ